MDQNSPRVVNGLKLPPKRVIKVNRPVDNAPKEWHYHGDDGSERGPFSTNSLKGLIGRETLVWKEGLPEWKRAADVPELAAILANVKPELPPSAIPEKWVWALAAVPIPVSWFLAGMVESASIVTVATIALNILFLMLDIQALKKTGRDINKVLWLGLILVPIYLFVRAAKYSKKYAPAIVWCVLFVLDLSRGGQQLPELTSESITPSAPSSGGVVVNGKFIPSARIPNIPASDVPDWQNLPGLFGARLGAEFSRAREFPAQRWPVRDSA